MKLSLRKTLNLVKAGRLSQCTYRLSEITLGILTFTEGEETSSSYSATIWTRDRKTALMASCHEIRDRGNRGAKGGITDKINHITAGRIAAKELGKEPSFTLPDPRKVS